MAVERVVADEERLLDVIKPDSQEAIVSCMSLHWINDLPGSFILFYYPGYNTNQLT